LWAAWRWILDIEEYSLGVGFFMAVIMNSDLEQTPLLKSYGSKFEVQVEMMNQILTAFDP